MQLTLNEEQAWFRAFLEQLTPVLCVGMCEVDGQCVAFVATTTKQEPLFCLQVDNSAPTEENQQNQQNAIEMFRSCTLSPAG